MRICKICGEETGLTGLRRFWSPDDGWVVGRLCQGCIGELKRRPKRDDYAWDRRGEYVSDEDDYIDEVYG